VNSLRFYLRVVAILMLAILAACSAAGKRTPPPVLPETGQVAPALSPAAAGSLPADILVLDTGDVVRISVFQSPDLQTETRVDEAGSITLPLVGALQVRGRTPRQAEAGIAEALERGKFLKQPQVTVTVVTFRSAQVSVLGNVNRPGRYPLDLRYTLSDMLALAGGVTANGADSVTLSRHEGARLVHREIDLETLLTSQGTGVQDVVLQAGDVLYVRRAPMLYVHGEVQRPGSFRVERGMTLRQAIAAAGGVGPRGTLRGVRVQRTDGPGLVRELRPDNLDAPVQEGDVIFVRESLF
jgi:polysaccharide export outer membrane protein